VVDAPLVACHRVARGSFASRMGGTPASEGAGEAEGDAVGLAIGAGELSGWDSVPRCAENCSSSFHCPPSFTRPHTMTNLGVPVLSTKETSTVAVAVMPDTSSTVKEWIVELRIS
jgi:hypothetical protein